MSINRDHARLMRRATAAALATAILLALSKAVAWWLSGSVSLLAGLTDSLLDGAASLLNLLAVHYRCARRTTITATAMARPRHWPGWGRRHSSASARSSSACKASTACCIRNRWARRV